MGVEKVLVVNGKAKRKRTLKRVLDNFKGDKIISESSEHAADFIISKEPSIIEIFGGDGTFSSTLNSVLEKEPEFLEGRYVKIIPGGSGNDKYRSLKDQKKEYGVSYKTNNGLDVVVDDYLLATVNKNIHRAIFNVGGIGLDAQTTQIFEKSRNWFIPGFLRYKIAGLKAIRRLKGFESIINYNLNIFEGDNSVPSNKSDNLVNPLMFLFMLGKYFGKGMPINKKFEMNDGLFEPAILKKGSHPWLYKSLFSLSLLKQGQYKNPLVDYLPLTNEVNIAIIKSDDFMFESDGELLKNDSEPVIVRNLSVKTQGKINYLV